MSKVINIAAVPGMIQITNIFDPADAKEDAASLLQTVKDNDLWNTGDAMVGDPHIDEVANAGKAFVVDKNGWATKHIAAIPVFRTNGYIYLLPGDSIVLETRSGEESLHYLTLNDPLLEVAPYDGPAIEGPTIEPGDADHPVEGKTFEQGVYYPRTTGIGDEDDGNDENGTYPFQFDTAEATAEFVGLEISITSKTAGITLAGNALSGALAAAATTVVLTITAEDAELTVADATKSGDDFTFTVFAAGGERSLSTADIVATKDGISTTRALDFTGVTYTAG